MSDRRSTRPPPPTRVILFDIGGVLLRWRDEWIFERVARQIGTFPRKAGAAILANRSLLQSGRLGVKGFWTRISTACGRPLPRRWKELWEEDLLRLGRENRAALAIARSLTRRGLEVGLFSNVDASHVRLFERRGWFAGLDRRFYSFELRAVKPNPSVYRRVRARLGVPAGAILLVDDRPENFEGARREGWQAVRYVGAIALRRGLQGLRLMPAKGGGRHGGQVIRGTVEGTRK
ncbi:MAG TPA: HAD-IA family hydrolase [Thermoplasmata archaeon]|nr:HAD-IA family hydrolase [Thermoplasmata archaeon]